MGNFIGMGLKGVGLVFVNFIWFCNKYYGC